MKEWTKVKILGVLLALITILFFVNQKILKTLGDSNLAAGSDSSGNAHRDGASGRVKPFFPDSPGNEEKTSGVKIKDGDQGEGQMSSGKKDVILLQ